MNDPGLVDEILKTARVIATIGYSPDPSRASNSVSQYLRRHGYKVIPVNPTLDGAIVDGEQSYSRIRDIPESIDLVDVFRRGKYLDEVVDDAVAAAAPTIWFQLDLGNISAAERAETLGLRVVWDLCIAIEHRHRARERR